MNHSRSLNNRINTLHERGLRLAYNDFTFFFTELLQKDNPVTIYQKNLQNLAIKMFKAKHKLSPEIETEIFRLKTRSYCYIWTETLSSLGMQIWDLISIELRNFTSLNAVKSKIKS